MSSNWTLRQPSVSFTDQDIAMFSNASGDRNPLHRSKEYARRTPYGQPVVFGCLGAMACLGQIQLPEFWSIKSLEANFLRPMFPGVQYRIEAAGQDGTWKVRLVDGRKVVVSITVTAELAVNISEADVDGSAGAFERTEAVIRSTESIVPGLSVSGAYRCNSTALSVLEEQFGGVSRIPAIVLSWVSYLIGMELPGESALFSKLLLHFGGTTQSLDSMTYHASVSSVDSRFGLIEADVSLLAGVSVVASGQCRAYLRPPVPVAEEIISIGVRRDSLVGRVALILGSSRGLGAAMKLAMDFRGAIVYGMARSGDGEDPSRIEIGDAADPEALRRLRERISTEHGRLDFLICNACPPVQPLDLTPNALARAESYISLAVSLTLAPLSEFLDLLDRSDGCAVFISSAFVESPQKDWPHYIAAKEASEALVRVASLQYPRVSSLIVRPPKLLTAMSNTPIDWMPGASPALVASRIVSRLEDPMVSRRTEVLGFPDL